MTEKQEHSGEDKRPSVVQNEKVQAYLRYSGMAFELLGLIFFAVIIGTLFDRWIGTEKPYFTAAFVLFFFTGYILRLFYQTGLSDEEKEEKN